MDKQTLYENIMSGIAEGVIKAIDETLQPNKTNYGVEEVENFAKQYLDAYYNSYKCDTYGEYPNWGELYKETPEFSTQIALDLIPLFMDGNCLEASIADKIWRENYKKEA